MGADNHGIRAIFFDFGGVILEGFDGVDHDAIEAEFGLEAKALRKWVYRDSRYMDFQIGRVTYDEWTDSIRKAMAAGGQGERAEEMVKRFQDAERLVNHDMVGLIKRLHGRYKLGIISNTIPGMMDRLRRLLDFVDLFDVVVGSGDVGIAKPDEGDLPPRDRRGRSDARAVGLHGRPCGLRGGGAGSGDVRLPLH